MATSIRVQNCYSWLKTDDEDLNWKLWKSLRFKARNYWHSRLYRQKIWDGWNCFYKKESGKFLTGLLPEIKTALQLLNIEYDLIDERTTVKFIYDKIDANFLNQWNKDKKPFILHDYQVDFTNQLIDPDSDHRAVILAPTSSGKTAVMISFLKCLDPKTPTLILANKKQLCEQNYDALKQWGFTNVGRFYDRYADPNVFTCSTIQSIHKLESLIPHIKALVVDEIHEMTSKRSLKLYNKMSSCCARLAVSATPFKFGGKDKSQKYTVKGYFGPVLKTDSTAAENGVLKTNLLQDRKQLSKAECIFYPVTEPKGLEYAIWQDAVEHGVATNVHFHKQVVDLARSMTGRTLIIVERLLQGDYIKKLMPEALWIQGKDDLETRRFVINELNVSKGNFIGIATQGIFNTGLSVFLMNLINAASGQAEHVILQRFGRGLRVADDKEVLHYRDFLFKINPYLDKHSRERIKILEKEGHQVTVLE